MVWYRTIQYDMYDKPYLSLSPLSRRVQQERKKGEPAERRKEKERQQEKRRISRRRPATDRRENLAAILAKGENPTAIHDTKFACIVHTQGITLRYGKYVIISTTQVFRVQYL